MLTFVFIFAISSCLCEYYVTTYAGSNKAEHHVDGAAVQASFYAPYGVAADAFGNLFVADCYNFMIRKINSTGYVSTVAGNGVAGYSDAQGVLASFNYPSDVAVDLFGNLFVTDTNNNMIRKINATGYVSTLAGNVSSSFADGQSMDAEFNGPTGLAIDVVGNIIVADASNNRIRRVNSTCYVATVAGNGNLKFELSDGQGTEASFNYPTGVAIDSDGNIFVVDSLNNRIRKINSTGYTSGFAGDGSYAFSDGPGAKAAFNNPIGITIDSIGNLFVTDPLNLRIRKIDSSGYVTTIAGTGEYGYSDGKGSKAKFQHPQGITIDQNGIIFVTEYLNNMIRKIYFSGSTSSSPAFSPSASLTSPSATQAETITFSAPALTATTPQEFTYSALIGMFIVGSVLIFIASRKANPKVLGRRERFIQNMEFQRKLELKQRQQSLPRNPFQRDLNQK